MLTYLDTNMTFLFCCTTGVRRTLSSIEGKINQMFSKYNNARALKDQSGGGVKTEQERISFDAYILRKCPYFDLLDPVMRDKHNSKPSYTNEDKQNNNAINLVGNDSDSNASDTNVSNSDSESDNNSAVVQNAKLPAGIINCDNSCVELSYNSTNDFSQSSLDTPMNDNTMSVFNTQTCSSASAQSATNDIETVATQNQSTHSSSPVLRKTAYKRKKQDRDSSSCSKSGKMTPVDARNITNYGNRSPGRGKNLSEILQQETLQMINNLKEQQCRKDSIKKERDNYQQRKLAMKEKKFKLRHTRRLMQVKEEIVEFNERMYDKRQKKKETNPSITNAELEKLYPFQELDMIDNDE